MSILKRIKSAAGNLFKNIKKGATYAFTGTNAARLAGNVSNAFSGGISEQSKNALDPSGQRERSDMIRNERTPYGASGSWQPSSGYSFNSSPSSSYTPQYGGQINPGNRQVFSFGSSSGGGSSGGSVYGPAAPERLTGESAKQYARSANLQGLNLEGMTYEEADKIINETKDTQRSQVTANTSAVFSDSAPSAVEKRVRDLSLSLDNTRNDTWKSALTKQDEVDNMLKSTAKDLAEQFDSPEAMAEAYHSNSTVQNALDTFASYGGSDQMLIDAVNEKVKKGQGLGGNNMSTADYVAQTQQKETNQVVSGDQVITDEIARVAQIPEQKKELYFGEEGIWQQRVNLAKENIKLLKEKIADDRASAREQARYYMEKNNAELALAKSTIEQNRVNAKNYITGMLAKLGALNTTSAAVEGIAILDQRYQQQAADAESKVRFANQEIEIKLRDTINKIESAGDDKILAIKEDLSKDQETIMKEILKAEQDSEKRIFDLTMKANDKAKKNLDEYTNTATKLAEDWTTAFNTLVSNGLDIGKAAAAVNVKLPVADQRISTSARIKDPSAIAYFKTLPKDFQNEWIQFASTQPQGTFFTIADLQANYEPYVLEQRQKDTKKTTTTDEPTMTDEEFLNALSQ